MLHVQIQILNAIVRTSVNDFQLDLAKGNPMRSLDLIVRCAVMIPSRMCCICPRPSNAHVLEIHIRTMSSQSRCKGRDVKQSVCNAHSAWDIDQNVFARLHQIEPITMNVLQMGITNGSSPVWWRRAGRRGRSRCQPHEVVVDPRARDPVDALTGAEESLPLPRGHGRRRRVQLVHDGREPRDVRTGHGRARHPPRRGVAGVGRRLDARAWSPNVDASAVVAETGLGPSRRIRTHRDRRRDPSRIVAAGICVFIPCGHHNGDAISYQRVDRYLLRQGIPSAPDTRADHCWPQAVRQNPLLGKNGP
mmetsp:Transcript_52348/g.119658  ORF Transcript_52348/g.119658 Transcript_52348/m.119658 type:complete len:305 (+) Transcript_52348:221-1135(+)